MKFSDQVVSVLKAMHPGVRKDIRRALSDLEAGRKRNVRRLERELAGFSRLRVGKYRAIFRHGETGEIIVEYLDSREVVYQEFERQKDLPRDVDL